MKRIFASLLATIALVTTGAASLGCMWFMADEPHTMNLFND